jgi:hypothetical protein
LKKRKKFGNFNISENNLISVEAAILFFFLTDFSQFVKNLFKKKFCHKLPLFARNLPDFYLFIKNCKKNRHNCLQYKTVLKIFYFHTLTIAKFG